MSDIDRQDADVIVVGAGNAGLLAAIAAREAGADVLLIEASSKEERGGNSRFASGVYRVAHSGERDIRALVDDDGSIAWDRIEIEEYPADRFLSELRRSTAAQMDEQLMGIVVERSLDTVRWMSDHGVRWSLSMSKFGDTDGLPDTLKVRMPAGGELIAAGNGVGLVESLFTTAESLGVRIRYDSPVTGFVTAGRTVRGVVVQGETESVPLTARAVVLAAGGFEASAEARLRYLGPGWDLVKVRGSRYDTGAVLELAIAHGARSAGHWSGAHAVPIDAAAPPVGDLSIGDSTARYSYPYGITVNVEGRRFLDEGSDEMVFTYAEIGRQLLGQPQVTGYQIFDGQTLDLLEPRYKTAVPIVADSIADLAQKMGVPTDVLIETIDGYNASCADGAFDPFSKDGKSSRPVGQPPKSNWALPIHRPPFHAYRVTCGITFTFGGVAVDSEAHVIGVGGRPIPGLLAAGELTGGFFAYNVPSGTGLSRGAVFGRIAGETAARMAADR
ncbi:FAD-dependent tricarballylate dehydrogenase TcuA [Microbacterium sp. E-13]|uniref:FAD-dependent tricarballylate dehydrogenase TcuA n=1 Tax=Microbacterium sp. E-13 TaxID=3404048 RepID=UPI003CF69D7A